jgi:hypothetical protein
MESEALTIQVTDERSVDAGRLDESLLALRQELLEMRDVRSVNPSPAAPQQHAKSGSGQLVGSLLVTLSLSAPSLTILLKFLHEWLKRNEGKRVRLKHQGELIEIEGLSERSIKELLDRWETSADHHEP